MIGLRSISRFQAFLRREGLHFACAESCTGGLLSRRMTAVAGSSDVFWGSVVSYSNEAKTAWLGVPPELIERDGAVSATVALAMVNGVVRASSAALAVSITGVAGPSGGTEAKPVGTVWFGLSARRETLKAVAVRCHFRGNRATVQRRAASWALRLATLRWESGLELDSLQSLADNTGKAVIEAFSLPSPPSSQSF